MKTKNICIVLLFLVINSAVFAQKVELIREIKLNGNLSEIYNETFSNPLSVGIDTVKGKASCYYTPDIFIDENNIFFTIAGKHNNFFQILKDSDGRDVLYSKEIIPVFNSDCTKLFCITNVSYDSEKIIEDDYTIYIYDITY